MLTPARRPLGGRLFRAARGNRLAVTRGASSVAGSPGGTLAIAVPEVTIKRSAGALEGRAERLDDTAVGFAICRELGEIMVEGEMDDAVRTRGALQAVGIVDRSAIDLSAGGGQRLRRLVRTADADHLMARADQFLNDGRADKSGRAGDKYSHDETFMVVEDLEMFYAAAARSDPK